MTEHLCVRKFQTTKIDDCCGEGYNKCSGTKPMVLEIWFMDQDGTETFRDNWITEEVNFCPYCGMKADLLQ